MIFHSLSMGQVAFLDPPLSNTLLDLQLVNKVSIWFLSPLVHPIWQYRRTNDHSHHSQWLSTPWVSSSLSLAYQSGYSKPLDSTYQYRMIEFAFFPSVQCRWSLYPLPLLMQLPWPAGLSYILIPRKYTVPTATSHPRQWVTRYSGWTCLQSSWVTCWSPPSSWDCARWSCQCFTPWPYHPAGPIWSPMRRTWSSGASPAHWPCSDWHPPLNYSWICPSAWSNDPPWASWQPSPRSSLQLSPQWPDDKQPRHVSARFYELCRLPADQPVGSNPSQRL